MNIKLEEFGVLSQSKNKELEDIKKIEVKALDAFNLLLQKRDINHIGWLDLPDKISQKLILDIEAEADKIRESSELFVVIGIGGSYLGARAIIEALETSFHLIDKNRNHPKIIYAGHNLSEDYLSDLVNILDQYDYSLTIISKSGTTLEPSISFRVIKDHIEKKYGREGARKRIIAITDREKGSLNALAKEEGYKSYYIPDDVGGRFSVLSPVGLLPIAVAGFDISKLIEGSKIARYNLISNPKPEDNPAIQYAIYRNFLYEKGFSIELMVNYLPNLVYFSEWWKQLYGESEGKEGKGLFPASVTNTADLHSLGQYIQEGRRVLFETVLSVETPNQELRIPSQEDSKDGLDYIKDRRVNEINNIAEKGSIKAHYQDGVPNIRIAIPKLNESIMGELIYFFEFSCAISAYILGVNPFDQPGVEIYKKNIYELLEEL